MYLFVLNVLFAFNDIILHWKYILPVILRLYFFWGFVWITLARILLTNLSA